MIILHPGMPKTGTTALQLHLAAHRAPLLEAGLLYPETGCDVRTGNHLPLVEAGLRGGETFDALVRSLRDEIMAKAPGVTMISSERLWNRRVCGPEILARLASGLGGQEVTVLVGLRELRSHALSGYRQRIKGRQRFAGSFLEHFLRGEADGVWDYAGRLDDFARAFGKAAVRAYRYEDFRAEPLVPLARAAGLPGIAQTGPVASSNASPGWFDIRLRRFGNRVARSSPRVGAAIFRSADGFERTLFHRFGRDFGSPLSPEAEELLAEIGAERMSRVAEAYDLTWAR